MLQRMIINDDVIGGNCVQEIIAPLWNELGFLSDSDYQIAKHRFAQEQLHIFAVYTYQIMLPELGHAQFMRTEKQPLLEDLLKALEAIGALEHYQIMCQAGEVIKLEQELDAVNASDDLYEDGFKAFEDLDERFFICDDLNEIMLEYIHANRAAFYFDGMIDRK